MDWIREEYRSYMRPFRDRPDILVPGFWRFCKPGAKAIPYMHCFASQTHDPDFFELGEEVGELRGKHGHPKTKANPRLTGKRFCGSQDVWENGALYAQQGTPETDEEGVPFCCQMGEPEPGGYTFTADGRIVEPSGAEVGGLRMGAGLIAAAGCEMLLGGRQRPQPGSELPMGLRVAGGVSASANGGLLLVGRPLDRTAGHLMLSGGTAASAAGEVVIIGSDKATAHGPVTVGGQGMQSTMGSVSMGLLDCLVSRGGVVVDSQSPTPVGGVRGGLRMGGEPRCELSCGSTPAGPVATGLYADWDPASLSPSDGDPISGLPDSSGNGHHCTDPGPTQQPHWFASQINGLPAVEFALDDFLPVTGDLDSPFTLYAVIKPSATEARTIVGSYAGGLVWRINSAGRLEVLENGAGTIFTGGKVLAPGNWYIVSLKYDGDAFLQRVGTCMDGGVTSSVAFSGAGAFLGAHGNPSSGFPGDYFLGLLARVLVYDTNLSRADDADNLCYLKGTYNL